ncbi:MAG: hypothetical protein KDC49_09440 [Saprospiraceae bacterium]|nr:hypothetical protein [Saprospiraceae bacterium]
MNSSTITRNIIRAIGLLLFQVLVLIRVDLSIGDFTYVHFLIYPFIILLLPVNTPKAFVLISGFVIGIIVDMFYNSPGVHTAALLITSYVRSLILLMLQPYEGYTNKTSPTLVQMGFSWFISYIAIMLVIHCFAYFSFEAFTFVYFFKIFLNTIFTVIPTLILFTIMHLVFRSKY